jgi:hypothetical protein
MPCHLETMVLMAGLDIPVTAIAVHLVGLSVIIG